MSRIPNFREHYPICYIPINDEKKKEFQDKYTQWLIVVEETYPHWYRNSKWMVMVFPAYENGDYKIFEKPYYEVETCSTYIEAQKKAKEVGELLSKKII